MVETITLPKHLIEDLIKYLNGLNSITATIEELLDEEGLKKIKEGMKDYEEKRYITVKNLEELRKELFEK